MCKSGAEDWQAELDRLLGADAEEYLAGAIAAFMGQVATQPGGGAWLDAYLRDRMGDTGWSWGNPVAILGHLPCELVEPWGFALARDALEQASIRVRDAAVRVLERWGGLQAVSILRGHNESEPWLRAYIGQVIADLSERESDAAAN